jgi:prepilin peptidase CpaA
MHVPHALGPWLVLPIAILMVLCASDLRDRKLPNQLTTLLFVLGLSHALVIGGWAGGLASLLGACTGVLLLLWQHAKGLIGAGDVKLLAAIGAWTGALGAVAVLLVGSVIGGALALVALLSLDERSRREVAENLARIVVMQGAHLPPPTRISRARGVPFGVSLAIAAVFLIAAGTLR